MINLLVEVDIDLTDGAKVDSAVEFVSKWQDF